jgi:hypothetical protein
MGFLFFLCPRKNHFDRQRTESYFNRKSQFSGFYFLDADFNRKVAWKKMKAKKKGLWDSPKDLIC